MYKYVGCEYLFRDNTGRLLSLDFESPVDYETEEEAEKDEIALRFSKENDEIMLDVFSREWEMIKSTDKGKSVTRTVATGELIARYDYITFISNLHNKIKRFVPLSEKCKNDFVRIDVNFEDLFPNMVNGETVYISGCESGYVTKKQES